MQVRLCVWCVVIVVLGVDIGDVGRGLCCVGCLYVSVGAGVDEGVVWSDDCCFWCGLVFLVCRVWAYGISVWGCGWDGWGCELCVVCCALCVVYSGWAVVWERVYDLVFVFVVFVSA